MCILCTQDTSCVHRISAEASGLRACRGTKRTTNPSSWEGFYPFPTLLPRKIPPSLWEERCDQGECQTRLSLRTLWYPFVTLWGHTPKSSPGPPKSRPRGFKIEPGGSKIDLKIALRRSWGALGRLLAPTWPKSGKNHFWGSQLGKQNGAKNH